jgi:hypothetical protein
MIKILDRTPLQFLKYLFLEYPFDYVEALRFAKNKKKYGLWFTALLSFLFVMMFAHPSHAIFIQDMTAPGRAISGAIANNAANLIGQIYGRPNAALALLTKVAQFVCLFIFSFSIMRYLANENDDPSDFKNDPVFLGSIVLSIMFSGGGYFYGQLYHGLFLLFEGILNKADDYSQFYQAIEAGKLLNASKAALSPILSVCQGMVGQEQAQCMADAAPQGIAVLKEIQSQSPGNPFLNFIGGAVSRLGEVAQFVVDPKTGIPDKIGAIFWTMISPAVETTITFICTAMIVVWDVIYFLTFIGFGFAGVIASLNVLLVPQFKGGYIAFLVGLVSLFLVRLVYLLGMGWFSKLILDVPDPQVGMGGVMWGIAGAFVWPMAVGGVVSLSAKAVWSGICNSAASGLSLVSAAAGMAVAGPAGAAAASGVASAATGGNGGGGGNNSLPAVRTD